MKFRYALITTIILIIIEILLSTTHINILGNYFSPIGYLLANIMIGVMLLIFGKNQELKFSKKNLIHPLILKINGFTIGLMLIIITIVANRIYTSFPIYHTGIDRIGSDVIPQIMLFVKRFLNVEYPYAPMPFPELNYTLIPTYLPLQWMPYIPAEIFRFDYRFIALSICFIAFIVFTIQVRKLAIKPIFLFICTLLPLIYFYQYILSEHSGFRIIVEYNVAAYYLLLGIALYKKQTTAIALAILLCLLSRYSFIIWLPLLGILGWWYLGKVATIKIMTIIMVGILILYAPYFLKDPLLFKKGYDYYSTASINEWTIQSWQDATDRYPHHLKNGLGFANYAYEFVSGTILEKIKWYQNLHIILCLVTTAALGIYWWMNKSRYTFSIITIASLKIYLAIFYSFVIIPYPYLYILPNLFSFIVLLCMLNIYSNQKTLV